MNQIFHHGTQPDSTHFSLQGNSQSPTVYIVDDDTDVCESLAALVSALGMRWQSFLSAEAFLATYDGSPGCLITDMIMPDGMSGTELQQKLRDSSSTLPVIIITAYAETSLTVKAMQNGAVTLLEKPYREHELREAIRMAVSHDSTRREKESEARIVLERICTLSADEVAVLDLLIAGVPNRMIATQLEVCVRTVENRRHRIYERLEATTVAELVRKVVEARLVSDRKY